MSQQYYDNLRESVEETGHLKQIINDMPLTLLSKITNSYLLEEETQQLKDSYYKLIRDMPDAEFEEVLNILRKELQIKT